MAIDPSEFILFKLCILRNSLKESWLQYEISSKKKSQKCQDLSFLFTSSLGKPALVCCV
jgi:hypothetical protein